MTEPRGVLLMAYGTPASLDEVEAYYTHIRHGRPPTPELLADLKARYQAIGGVSPLNDITRRQAAALQARLDAIDGPGRWRVFLGMKHTRPFIQDIVREMAASGVKTAVTLVLAPHYSTMSVKSYQTAADQAAAEAGPRLWHVDSWHLQPQFLQALAERVTAALARLSAGAPSDGAVSDGRSAPSASDGTPGGTPATVIFSAHSLPERILEADDPYPRQLRETGEAVARLAGVTDYTFAWQSAGRTDDRWLGPDILDVIRQLAGQGRRRLVVCPAGFVADHLEVLYDVDIDCQRLAAELGVQLVRTASLNDDPLFIAGLADVVRARAARGDHDE
ncbi:ferrochelatase [Alicyclobacillus macrosporangiidus]|uniref:Coproporphyrin III ferrochelatase n=1 Tax=Alicyclobacillus macrosporangiidus TaxID=392015 RepID=A0A1I7L2V3_9BACL|nr:ferrochelatase [Alicyclobacillus macrosporangiidus]SFV04112.1 ferrochelatase [Alicyclobacillus macrosporangiidus]